LVCGKVNFWYALSCGKLLLQKNPGTLNTVYPVISKSLNIVFILQYQRVWILCLFCNIKESEYCVYPAISKGLNIVFILQYQRVWILCLSCNIKESKVTAKFYKVSYPTFYCYRFYHLLYTNQVPGHYYLHTRWIKQQFIWMPLL
jgi:hypothetical protein